MIQPLLTKYLLRRHEQLMKQCSALTSHRRHHVFLADLVKNAHIARGLLLLLLFLHVEQPQLLWRLAAGRVTLDINDKKIQEIWSK